MPDHLTTIDDHFDNLLSHIPKILRDQSNLNCSHLFSAMASTPMDVDEPSAVTAATAPSLNIQRSLGGTTKVSDVITTFRPTKLFRREDIKDKDAKPKPSVLSIDFDDPGELCMTAESDETIMIYNVKEGRHDKKLLSQKYGAKLAKFTHASSSIIYASTKQNGKLQPTPSEVPSATD